MKSTSVRRCTTVAHSCLR